MKILFINLSAIQFTVATPEISPLGGTESCLAYLARELAKTGHDITLIAQQPPETPARIMGVRHAPPQTLKHPDFFLAEAFDVIVVCNAAFLCPVLKAINPTSLLLLWDHVPPDQPSVKDLGRPDILNAIDSIVYVSEWQKQETERYFKFEKKSCVIGNGLTPAFENMFSSPEELLQAKENRAAYITIPYRGLAILLKVMADLREDTELDLFSSMRVYQMADDEYADLYREAAQNPRIHSHGSVAQPVLAKHLRKTAFLAYPCICAETFCIGALESIAAGMKVLSTNLGALPTTTMGYADLVPVLSSNPQSLITSFRDIMSRAIRTFLSDPTLWAEERYDELQTVNRLCTWSVRSVAWQKNMQILREHMK